MNASFTQATQFTSGEEGGYVSDPRDSGNWSSGVTGKGTLIGSNMGVGAATLIAWEKGRPRSPPVTAAYMRALPQPVYEDIAMAEYWHRMPCDSVPAGIDLMLFDYGWNRGCGNSVRQLQEALGVTIDGQWGPISQAAMDAVDEPDTFMSALAAVQIRHYRALSNFNVYGGGWLARTSRRYAAALALSQQGITT